MNPRLRRAASREHRGQLLAGAPVAERQLELAGIPTADEDLERITAPTSLIWGRDDLSVLLDVGEAASARHGWPLHVIDAAGDNPPLEQPSAFVAALQNQLRAQAEVATGGAARLPS